MQKQKLSGTFLVKTDAGDTQLPFEKISSPLQYQGSPAIIVKSLSPKYALLIGSLKLIVARRGSKLSHLAIVAREHGVPVFLCENELESLPAIGKFSLEGDGINVI